jgi:hypothetical protein
VHHRNGESFSGDPFLDPIFDSQLYAHSFLHNKIFRIEMGSNSHFIFSMIADMAMGLINVVVILMSLHAATSIVMGLHAPMKQLEKSESNRRSKESHGKMKAI